MRLCLALVVTLLAVLPACTLWGDCQSLEDEIYDHAEDDLACKHDDIGWGTRTDGRIFATGCGRVAYYSCGSKSCRHCSLVSVVGY